MRSERRMAIRGGGRRGGARGFALLEVMVSLTILGIAVASLMQSFAVSLAAIRRNEITTQACALADTLLQNLETEPPLGKRGTEHGTFEAEGYPKYSWELRYEREEQKYRRKNKSSGQYDDLKDLHRVELTISYDDGRMKRFDPVKVATYLADLERYTQQAKQQNGLFEDDGDRRR